MIQFMTTIHKFAKQGEKTGWTYIEISAVQAKKLKPDTKVSFRVKGTLDSFKIKQIALLPMGDGNFIMPLNAAMRKGIGKKLGDKLKVSIEVDDSEFAFSKDFMACLHDDPVALDFFQTLTALSKKQGYPEMMRANKGH
jgi:Domain of unknown function (DUF1905)